MIAEAEVVSGRRVLLAGPDLSAGPESHASHLRRLGPLPVRPGAGDLIALLEDSGLRGRGGAAFPVGRKWRTVAGNGAGRAVLLVNGAEGEPLSVKDRTLMSARPHLVLDGALLAANAVGARDIILYIGSQHRSALTAMHRALLERGEEFAGRTHVVEAPAGYVSGEESAAVHFVNEGIALPTSTPPRVFERGVKGRPTLVQNVESLAIAALIARCPSPLVGRATPAHASGAERAMRAFEAVPGGGLLAAYSELFTASGSIRNAGILELEVGTTIGGLAEAAGGLVQPTQAVLVGGYFGTWESLERAWSLPLEQSALKQHGLAIGCGAISFLSATECGVIASARILTYLAQQSARQCGPCMFGLSAMSQAAGRLAQRQADSSDLNRLHRWAGQLPGRGACKHPDGAAAMFGSALRVFSDEFDAHQRGRCHHDGGRVLSLPPRGGGSGWGVTG